MNTLQDNELFTIDTKPTTCPTSYESDYVDSETEQMLYSAVHHAADSDNSVTINQLQQPNQCDSASTNPRRKRKSDSISKEKRKSDSSKFNPKKRIEKLCGVNLKKKSQPETKKRPKLEASVSSKSSVKHRSNKKEKTTTTIVLSDSDDELGIIEEKKDLWHIDHVDILINDPINGNLYRPKVWCSRCRKQGNHTVKLCHLRAYKVCHICGEIGHTGAHCQNKHCKKCMDFHPTSSCNFNVKRYKCDICFSNGHLEVACPNHWRKFCNITDPKVNPDKSRKSRKRRSLSTPGHHKRLSSANIHNISL